MQKDKIHYAVIALTKSNVKEVIQLLESQRGNDVVIEWLKENESRVYGKLPEDWKPFGNYSIKKIMEKNAEDYHSETHVIAEYIKEITNSETHLIAEHFNVVHEAVDLLYIDVFFIDMFSMYLPDYNKLAQKSDSAFCRAKESKCCFLMDYTLPINVQRELEKMYNDLWMSVASKYREGCLHRLAARIDDLNNFKNYLIKLPEFKDRPNLKTSAKISNTILKNNLDQPLEYFSFARKHV